MAARNSMILVTFAAAGVAVASCGALAQISVPVTVYDQYDHPYTAYGTAEAGGAVIVFDTDPFAWRTGRRATPGMAEPGTTDRAVSRGSQTTQPPSPPPPPLETSAGPGKTPAPTPPAAAQGAERAAAPGGADRYVDGVYLVNTDYLVSYPLNLYRILTAPARFDRDDWLTAALVVGAGAALLMLDEPLRDFWQDDVRGSVSDDLSDVFREFGESRTILFGSLGAYVLAEALDSGGALNAKREKAAALLTLQSFAITQGLITGLKYATGRNRPEDTADGYDFAGPTTSGDSDSFPSGHAGGAFALASVVSATYGPDSPWVPWVAYPIAAGTALSRVNDNRHWVSDVFVGGAIGYFVGQAVVRYSPFLIRNNLTLLPFDQDGARGLSAAYRF